MWRGDDGPEIKKYLPPPGLIEITPRSNRAAALPGGTLPQSRFAKRFATANRIFCRRGLIRDKAMAKQPKLPPLLAATSPHIAVAGIRQTKTLHGLTIGKEPVERHLQRPGIFLKGLYRG